MRRYISLLSLVILASVLTAPSSEAAKIHISFVMINPVTHKNIGPGARISISLVNRTEHQETSTDSNGVASFDISPLDYVLNSNCGSCRKDFQSSEGTQYLISPQPNGSMKVLSAADEVMKQDDSGNWIISIKLTREVVGNDPWQILKTKPDQRYIGHLYLLTNGKVLVQTYNNQNFNQWWLLTPDAFGNYVSGTWTKAAQPPEGYNPQNVNGAVLHSGNFFIVGGEQNITATGAMEEDSNQSYLYDVENDKWIFVPPPNNGMGEWAKIGASPFTELADGRVMVGALGDRSPGCYNKSMLFDETTMNWTLTGDNKIGCNLEAGYTLLSNDKVLIVGTDWGTKSTELYDPATGSWTSSGDTVDALSRSEIGPALTLPNGKVLAMGATGHNGLYDPITNKWSSVPDFPKLKNGLQPLAADNPAAVLPNGNVLVQTSVFVCSTENCIWMAPAIWYEYDINSNTWELVSDDPLVPSSSATANGTNALVLPNGQVLVATEGNIEVYSSTGVPHSSWLPKIDSISSNDLSPSTNYSISGKQLSGLTQGTAWGDEQQNSTNYGLVQITNKASQHVFYARTKDLSNTSIAPGVPSTLTFTFNKDVEDGPSSLRVIASGVSSDPVDVTISGGYDKVAADKAIADKSAAELKAKQDAEAKAAADKAAAELKAKQDAEAKAAADKASAELKAKQDAEAKAATDKAAAELKAKQDAEAKAAADKAAAELKAKQDADAKAAADKLAKAAVKKKTTITCIKGKSSKKITAIKPTCPAGYKKK